MTLAHLPVHPLQRFFSYTFGYASAPDGFVFLSGLVSTWGLLAGTQQARPAGFGGAGPAADPGCVPDSYRPAGCQHRGSSSSQPFFFSGGASGSDIYFRVSAGVSTDPQRHSPEVLRFPSVHAAGAGSNDEGPRLAGRPDQRDSVVGGAMGYRRRIPPSALDQPGNIQHSGVAGVLRGRAKSRLPETERPRKFGSEVARFAGGLYGACAAFFPGPPQLVPVRSTAAPQILHWPRPDTCAIPGRCLPGLCDLVDPEDG
jgi:hypothetical protein